MARALLDDLRAQHARNYGWSLACCDWQRELAEDVLQEAYLRVLDGRAAFAGQSAASTWFFAVIRRVAGEARRGQQRRSILGLRVLQRHSDAGDGLSATQGDAADAALQGETAVALRDALMQLSQRQREILHLVFYGELTLEEAAATLSISPGSARTHYHRGKLRLAELLNLEAGDALDT